jgi:lysozyme
MITNLQAFQRATNKFRRGQEVLGGITADGIPGGQTLTRYLALRDAAAANPEGEWQPDAPSQKINSDGLLLVQHFEGLYLTAYQDEVGIWTIGYGHTGLTHNDGTVHSGRQITREQAIELLKYDMGAFEKRVAEAVDVPLNGNEFSALVSFDFNTGAINRSTLLRLLNSGDRSGAANEFPKWNRAGGQILSGLTRRRASERNLFLSMRPYIIP